MAYESLIASNAARWGVAKLTRGPEFMLVAKRLVAAKARYQSVEAKTGVPWFVIAVIHERESSQDFSRSLAQGDPWNKISTHVPAGRGPFPSWESAAIDALVICPPHASLWKDWSPGGAMTLLEMYNGLSYASHNVPSPYVWSGTDQYVSGKVLVDHGPIEYIYPSGPHQGQRVVDVQLGCAGLLLAMQVVDPSIHLGAIAQHIPTPTIPVPPAPVPPAQNWLSALISAFLKIFKRN